eukprot:9707519-Lingulodinium_polyedra.AAC.1
MIAHLARSLKQSAAPLVAYCLCMVLPPTLQDEEDQRSAIARHGNDCPTNALRTWPATGRPFT